MKKFPGWVVDVLVGWVVGSVVLGLAFGLLFALFGDEAAGGSIGVVLGTVLGIILMRRWRAAREDGESSPDESVPSVEVAEESPSSPDRKAPRAGTWLAVIAGLVIVALVASNAALWLRLQDSREEVSKVQRQVVAIDPASDLDCSNTSGWGVPICAQLDDMQSQIDDAANLEGSISDLTDCVNAYMDTIGRWSYNINSHYTYRKC